MKKRFIIVLVTVLAVTALVLGGITLAKYISTLRDESSTLTGDLFYFRSNVLSDATVPPAFEVLGKSTEFVLVNAQDTAAFTAEDITYTITYSVLVSGEGESGVWEVKEDMTSTATLTGGIYSAQAVTVSPILWDRDEDGTAELYSNVLVEAKATAPHTKTLRAEFAFVLVPMELSYTYDRDFGVITMTVATNDDAGKYLISWTPGLLPDNADPTGILTNVLRSKVACSECGWIYDEAVGDPDSGIAAGTIFATLPAAYVCPECGAEKDLFKGQVVATLAASTIYRLHFFVPAEARSQIDAVVNNLLENGGEEAVLQLVAQSVTCIPYTE